MVRMPKLPTRLHGVLELVELCPGRMRLEAAGVFTRISSAATRLFLSVTLQQLL